MLALRRFVTCLLQQKKKMCINYVFLLLHAAVHFLTSISEANPTNPEKI